MKIEYSCTVEIFRSQWNEYDWWISLGSL